MKHLKIIAVSIAFSLTGLLQAQMSQLWGEAYNGSAGGQDHAVDIAVDKRLNTYVVGTASETNFGNEMRVLKYAPGG